MLFIRTNKEANADQTRPMNPESVMKTSIRNLFTRLGGASCVAWVLPALIAGLGLIPAGRVMAQTFTTLYSFTATSNFINSDGANPEAGLILLGNTLYGTAFNGGSSGFGTVFAVNTHGTGFTNIYNFTVTSEIGRASCRERV